LPEIVRRSENDIAKIIPDSKGPISGVPLDYFFDVDYLKRVLSTHCPQMKVYSSLNDLYNVPGLDPIRFGVLDIMEDFVNESVIAKPHEWSKKFNVFLDSKSPPAKRRYPIRVQMESTQYNWPTSADLPAVERNFGHILRVRKDARELAASALFNLCKKFNLNLDPQQGYHPKSFVGVHLRTEEDVTPDKFPPYVEQASYFLNYMVQAKSPVGYLASGATAENITAFAERAEEFNITVVTKQDILDGAELQQLEKFTWDQRALVDYEIMLRAGLVTGVSQSNFAWNLALRRAYAFGLGPDYVPGASSDKIQWQDKYSTLFGRNPKANAYRATIWP
jgi:hypothetical protein